MLLPTISFVTLFLPPIKSTSPRFVPGQRKRLEVVGFGVELMLVRAVVLMVVFILVVVVVEVVVVVVVVLVVVQVLRKHPVRSWSTFELTVRVRVRLMKYFNINLMSYLPSRTACRAALTPR